MSVLAEHRHSETCFQLSEARVNMLVQRDQGFLKASYGEYNFSCQCHPKGIGMHIKYRLSDDLYWIADNPKSAEHDPLCLFFSSKNVSAELKASKWTLPANIRLAARNDNYDKARSSPGEPSKSIQRHRLIKRILYRGLTESLALYNFGQTHDLNYIFFKLRDSGFSNEYQLEGAPLSKRIYAGKKGLVFMRQGFSRKMIKAGLLLLYCNDVRSLNKWITVDGSDHYPCRQGALESFSSMTGPYLLALLWGGDERPMVMQAVALPVVHEKLMLPLHPNGPAKNAVYQAFQHVKANRNDENKLYLKVNMLSEAQPFEASLNHIVDGQRIAQVV